jgi:uncharacterized protein YpmB
MNNKNIIIIVLIVIIAILAVGFAFTLGSNQNSENKTETNHKNTTVINKTNTTNNTPSDKYIGKNKAISIVKSNDITGGTNFVATLTTHKEKPMYKVTFTSSKEYDEINQTVYVDAVTGTIYGEYG